MSHTFTVTEDFSYGAQGTCRILEIKADTLEELQLLINRARKKKWFVWLEPQLLNSGQYGVVMEKGMPDFDMDSVVFEHSFMPCQTFG